MGQSKDEMAQTTATKAIQQAQNVKQKTSIQRWFNV